MAYYIVPTGTPNHKLVLEARSTDVPTPPYMPSGKTINWRKNGIVIKSGSTDDASMLKVNTSDTADAHFTAADSNGQVDFEIDGVFSNPVSLSNNLPTIESARVVSDAYGLCYESPLVAWKFVDADEDEPWKYRVKLGTAAGLGDLFDSEYVFLPQGLDLDGDGVVTSDDVSIITSLPGYPGIITTDPSFDEAYDLNKDGVIDAADVAVLNANMDGSPPVGPVDFSYRIPVTLAEGTTFHWTIEVTDGQKVDPFAIDYPPEPARTMVTASGSATVNTSPTCTNVLVNGQAPGSVVPVATPAISWTYADVDGQPQEIFHVRVAADPSFSDVLWDSGEVHSSATSIVYNYDGTGRALTPHVMLYVHVRVYDTFHNEEMSGIGTSWFFFSGIPVLSNVLVDSRRNPLDLNDPLPTLTWQHSDVDGDQLAGYEVRIADHSTDLGTDSFIGNVDATGTRITPEAHQYTYREEACVYGPLQDGVKYYFQVRGYDVYGSASEWNTGYFRLNSPPTATNVRVLPTEPYTSDDLTADYTFVDEEGTESDKTEVRWYRNGVEQSGLRNQRTISSAYTVPNDSWYFTVRPHDGVEYGSTYPSSSVTIYNRVPTATIIGLLPENPRKDDDLRAIFLLDDPDGDPVTAILKWYKSGVEQPALRNSALVPSSYLAKGDVWHFTVQPYDDYSVGEIETSSSVTVLNTPPSIDLMLVEGSVSPKDVSNPNPLIKWRYVDEDEDDQSRYHLAIGTEPLRTSGAQNALLPSSQFLVNGIVSTASGAGTVLAGNDVFDSGSVASSASSYKYLTEDDKPMMNLLPSDVSSSTGYVLSTDGSEMTLVSGSNRGEINFSYSGESGTFSFELSYNMDKKACRYAMFVDGIKIDEFQSPRASGAATQLLKSARLDSGSTISLTATPVDEKASGSFVKLSLAPKTRFEVRCSEFDELSGYVSQADGSIVLSGLAGTASYAFQFPSSSSYDVELHYVTEMTGSPSLVLYADDAAIMNFTYEKGAASRIRIARSVQINRGDVVRISGTSQGGALARVSKLVFIPKETLSYGARLEEGRTYYASVKVNDGAAWSDWYTTRFTMDGSAWASKVSNANGWTIETTFQLVKE